MEVIYKTLLICLTFSIISCSDNKKVSNFKEISSLYFQNNKSIELKSFTSLELSKFNYPIIEVRTNHIIKQVLFLTISERLGYKNYISGSGQGFTMNGALITKTNGFDAYLVSVEVDKNSPFTLNLKPDEWQNTNHRSYTFILPNFSSKKINFTCTLTRLEKTNLFIVDKNILASKIREDCTSKEKNFSNFYWVDENGFVWKSSQWISLRDQLADVYVLKQY